ncbi:phosphatase PAP2 family protein [Bifidobacterium sp. ESL0745]|uniref:phosphatase PAP2 family protein n=1 Tax=Bifidobacterium sp. ESL0745 TaxID=2983226 RepID=UPI0023F743F8|nr:phosphatase PAP2 family protein [Bifidobacterium sp. ESL0745]MDF7666085.1 phosphatase PAP2 family protein [Bifidobacterium sp. ESL0745]
MTDDSNGQMVTPEPTENSSDTAAGQQVPPRAQVPAPPSMNAEQAGAEQVASEQSQSQARTQPQPSVQSQSQYDPEPSSQSPYDSEPPSQSSPLTNVPEPVSFVAFGGESATFEDDGEVSVNGAFAADANSGAANIKFAGELSNDDDSKASKGSKDEAEIEKGLAQVDPLTVHPRFSSCILAVVLALLFLTSAAAIYWFGVHTLNGQSFDEIVWQGFGGTVPDWIVAVAHVLNDKIVIPAISLSIAILAFIVAAVRKRWWLVGQMAVFGVAAYGAAWLKRVLPRPLMMHTLSPHTNSAPSGHTLLAVGSVLVLLIAVPRVWRALVALLGGAYSILVAASVIVGRWHRPSDVLMSLLIGGGLMLLTLAFTRKSGMDGPGSRVSSASIQIVGSIMITFGIVCCAYAGYMLWQIYPGLDMMAVWAKNGACALTMAAIIGVGCLVFGLALAVRQLTASPLTRLGLVGAPPAPPQE